MHIFLVLSGGRNTSRVDNSHSSQKKICKGNNVLLSTTATMDSRIQYITAVVEVI